MKTVEAQSNIADDVLWGVAAIAAYIRRKRSATYYLISTGAIPAKKLGWRTIMARKSELDRVLASGAVIEPTPRVERVEPVKPQRRFDYRERDPDLLKRRLRGYGGR